MKKENNQQHLIIGAGEVGKSLYNVLKPHYSVTLRDVDGHTKGTFEILHICYPYIDNFIETTKGYIKKYNSELVIIHSTVPVGTTRKIAQFAVHSPIRGVHPNLEDSIKVFVKYFGGQNAEKASRYFSDINIETKAFDKSETTELSKILSTTYYAWNVLFAKEVKRICDEFGLDFDDVYTVPNQDYNKGYTKLGLERVVRPVLKYVPGSIGGHCLIPNCEFLDDWITDIIKDRNKEY